jgi:hypothetical protein
MVAAALAASLPLSSHAADAPREATASQVFVAAGPVYGDAYSYEISCAAGSEVPVDALVGRVRHDQSFWGGSLGTVSQKSTSGSSINILGNELADGSRSIERSGQSLEVLEIQGIGDNRLLIGQQATEIVMIVAPIGGTFDTCSMSIDGEDLETRLLTEASAGYVDLGGADRNAVWTQNPSGALGFGTRASVSIGAGPYLANCALYGSAVMQATVFGTSNIEPIPATPLRIERCGGGVFGGAFAGRIDLAGNVNEAQMPSLFHWVALKGF